MTLNVCVTGIRIDKIITYFPIILPKGFEAVSTGVVLVASVEGMVLVADADKVK